MSDISRTKQLEGLLVEVAQYLDLLSRGNDNDDKWYSLKQIGLDESTSNINGLVLLDYHQRSKDLYDRSIKILKEATHE